MRFPPLDLTRLRVQPLTERKSLSTIDSILVAPDAPLRPINPGLGPVVEEAADRIRRARDREAR